MDERIKSSISRPSWKHSIFIIKKLGVSFADLKVAEVGCGTGTASLILAHLGAEVTLIDIDKNILHKAGEIFQLYGYQASLVAADCLEEPPPELREKFDVVCSGGLAEHFKGEDRLKCIAFHKRLLRKGGVCLIGVPNKYSPFLQSIVYFRKLTGTWNITLEIPYTCGELNNVARKAGFTGVAVIGSEYLRKDAFVYFMGFMSAVIDLMPEYFRNKLRNYRKLLKSSIKDKYGNLTVWDINKYCNESAESIHKVPSRRKLSHILSSGLILIAYNEE